MARTGTAPLPYRKTDATPNLGALDESDDIRGGMGIQGLAELAKFVEEGGTLITEGSTTTIFPEYGITSGVTIEQSPDLFVRGSILRSRISDPASPIVYGYSPTELPVYFNQAPVLNAGNIGGRGGAPAVPRNPNAGLGQIVTPNAVPLDISAFEADGRDVDAAPQAPPQEDVDAVRARAAAGGRGTAPGRPRVVVQFASEAERLLLSGTLAGGELLASRAAAVDVPLGDGHVVMFAIRPFWRWQTQGTYSLGFNAIMNWNDLDAGR
jgi:hypothetical protein